MWVICYWAETVLNLYWVFHSVAWKWIRLLSLNIWLRDINDNNLFVSLNWESKTHFTEDRCLICVTVCSCSFNNTLNRVLLIIINCYWILNPLPKYNKWWMKCGNDNLSQTKWRNKSCWTFRKSENNFMVNIDMNSGF